MHSLSSYTLRPAVQEDFPDIRALIFTVRINPVGLDWRRFLLAEDETGRLIGTGQVKKHGDGSLELASIAVKPEWRRHGVARAVIERLLETHPRPIYLTCRSNLGPFYKKFGFCTLQEAEMPPYFRRVKRLSRLVKATGLIPGDLLVMGKT